MESTWKDEETGLIWELKTHDNVYDSYTLNAALKYAGKLNKDNFGGFNDWRVPTIDELKSIVSNEKNNVKFIKKELSEVCLNYYWSSTIHEEYKDIARVVSFYDGYVNSNYIGYNTYVRCVRTAI